MPDALLRGDLKSRYEAYAIARNWGWLNANEIRDART
jgi:phage portal protein BeeE